MSTDKALETTYSIRGVTRVVRTEPTGSAKRTQAAHMRACKEALVELRSEANAEFIAHCDQMIAEARPWDKPLIKRFKEYKARAEGRMLERLPDVNAWRKPAPYSRNFHGETMPAFNVEDYRAEA